MNFTLCFSLAEAKDTYSSVEQKEFSDQELGFGLAVLTENTIQSTSALTGWLGLGNDQALQFYFGLPSTSPFQLGIGAHYKKTIAKDNFVGFHLGGGIGLGSSSNITVTATTPVTGTQTSFFINLTGIAGIHFQFPDFQKALFNIDAGPTFQLGSGRSNLSISILSLSVVYLL